MPAMAKRKRADRPADSGTHKTPRTGVFIPTDWVDVADALASAQKMNRVWWLIDLIRQAAVAAGRPESELPRTPWDQQAKGG